MLEWVKMDSRFMYDARVQRLMEDYGYSGVGVYLTLRIAVSAMNEEGLPMEQLMAVCMPGCRKNKLMRIINDYGLFRTSRTGLVTFAPLKPDYPRACAPAHTRAHTPEDAPADTSARSSLDYSEKNSLISEESLSKEDSRSGYANVSEFLQAFGFVKPTVEEIAAYCRERNNGIKPELFYDYHESIGWVLGNKPVEDWKALIRVWEQRRESRK